MQQPFWKKLFSHFTEISIEQTSSVSNPYLEVILTQGRYQLVTKDAIYSFDDKYLNFYHAFHKVNWERLSGNRVLVLGLGLGSVIYILEKSMGRKMDYTAVELDAEICRMCQTYTLDEIVSYVEVINAEANSFLHAHEESYDLIIMDIFQSATIPEQFQSVEFLEQLGLRLRPDGLLFYNRMNITSEDKAENERFIERFGTKFPNYSILTIQDNLVLANDKSLLI